MITGGASKILGGAGKPEFKDQAPENGLLVGIEIALGEHCVQPLSKKAAGLVSSPARFAAGDQA